MKIKNRMRYARKVRNSSRPSTQSLTPNGSISWKLYQDCRLELDRFLDVLYDKDFERLIIEGKPTEAALKDAWNKIYLEYTELAGEGSYNEVLGKVTKINGLNAKIFLINGIVQHLQIAFDPELIKMLHFMGFPCDMKQGDDPEVKLKPVIARAKRLVVEMDIAQKDLEKLQETTHGQAGREYFDDWLDALSKHRAYAVKAKDISVAQFCRAIKRLSDEAAKKKSV